MIGFVTGVVVTGQLAALPAWPVLCLLVGIAIYTRRGQYWLPRVLCGLACACLWASCYGHLQLQQRLKEDCVKAPLVVSGVVSSLPVTGLMLGGGPRQRFEFSVAELSPTHCAGPSLLMLSYYGADKILPGERWQFEVALKKPWGLSNPGSYNVQSWFAQKGIHAVGSVRKAERARRLSAAGALASPQHRLRLRIRERIARLDLSRPALAILQAITVGDKSGLDPDLWGLLQRYGINHLLVISGLHIGLAAGVGYLLGRLLLRCCPIPGVAGSWIPLIIGLVLAAFYSALAGFTLPTQRALCMLGAFVCASILGRTSHPASNLLLAAVLVLALNPLAALGSGFWLSFGAVAFLLWLAGWQRGLGAIRRTLGTHGFMSLMMLPLGVCFFGGGSLVAMFANMLMIPLVGLVIVPLALLATLCFLCSWPMEETLWFYAAWPLEQLLPLAQTLATRGEAWLYHNMVAAVDEVLLGLLAVALLVMPVRPGLRLLAGLLSLPLWLPSLPPTNEAPASTLVTVLDVGQGTAVVISSGSRTLLYDTGGGVPDGVNLGQTVVLPYLRQMGLARLDTLVISHPDLDHSAGAADIINVMGVDRLRYGGSGPTGLAGRHCVAGEAWRWPDQGAVFQFLSPAHESTSSSNNSSCVLQVEIGDYRFLLPGDVESDRERIIARYWGDALHSDWLLAAHHGSKTSSSPTLLKRIRPGTVVISSGYANRFGHPHPRVLQQLDATGVMIWSTASSGALTFEIVPGEAIRVRPHRSVSPRYWM